MVQLCKLLLGCVLIKNVTHSKNLKLGFSRKLTCFSFILKLLDFRGTITQEDVLKIAKSTPIERLLSLKENNEEKLNYIKQVANYLYSNFDKTQLPAYIKNTGLSIETEV